MSRPSITVLTLILVVSPSMTAHALAQEATKPAEVSKPEQPSSRAAQVPTLLRVQVVLARYQGDKKVASVPYTFVVTTSQAAERMTSKLRMGVEVPVPITSFSMPGKPEGDKSSPVTSFQYRNVGTSIDCTASERGNGLFLLHLSVDSSSVYANAPGSSPLSPADMQVLASDKPFFRSFNISLDPVLRDGQSVQTVASTDPVTGEVVKIDLTLNVVK
jgi:hypothetical protein